MRNREDLQSVLDEMFAVERSFSFEVVRAWQNRYPQFAEDIARAVADWREFEFFALENEPENESAKLSPTAEAAMEKALSQFGAQTDEAITNLREFAEKRGVARASLLKLVSNSETVWRKMERRNLKEIPQWLEEKIAEVLRVSPESLRKFFALPSILSPAARYKSKNAPRTQPKQSFAEAVKNDPELSDEEKRRLLKPEPPI